MKKAYIPACFTDSESKKIIKELCTQNTVDVVLLRELCEVVGQYAGSGRKDGINAEISQCLDLFLARQE